MAQHPPSKKAPASTRPKDDASKRKQPQGDNYYDEFFQNSQPHQLDESPEPEQQRQWISDQLMWETTLGLREDDAINRAITPRGDEPGGINNNTPTASTHKKQLSEQERQLLRTQLTEPPVGRGTASQTKPAAHQTQRPRQPVPQQKSPQKPQNTPQPQRQQAQTIRPAGERQAQRPTQPATATQPVPRGLVQSAKASNTSNAAKTSKAPVKRVPPAAATTPNVVAAKQPGRTATTAIKPNRPIPSPDRASVQSQDKPSSKAGNRNPNFPQAHAKTSTENSAYTQTRPIMTKAPREAEISREVDLESTALEEMRREQYIRWAKKAVAILGIAIVSFFSGYYIGGKTSDEQRVAQMFATLERLKTDAARTDKVNKLIKKPAARKPKPKPKPRRKAVVPESHTAAQYLEANTQESNLPPSDTQQTKSANVFEGKDIPAASTAQSADATPFDTDQASEGGTVAAITADDNVAASQLPQDSSTVSPSPATEPANTINDGSDAAMQKTVASPSSASNTPSSNTATANPASQAGTQTAGNTQPQDNHQNEIQDLLKQSLQAFNNKQWQTLVDLSNKILALDPKTVNALSNRAAAYTELNLYALALNDCNTVIKIDPKNPPAINNRGYVYEKMGDLQNALSDYEAACNLGAQLSCKEVSRLKHSTP